MADFAAALMAGDFGADAARCVVAIRGHAPDEIHRAAIRAIDGGDARAVRNCTRAPVLWMHGEHAQ